MKHSIAQPNKRRSCRGLATSQLTVLLAGNRRTRSQAAETRAAAVARRKVRPRSPLVRRARGTPVAILLLEGSQTRLARPPVSILAIGARTTTPRAVGTAAAVAHRVVVEPPPRTQVLDPAARRSVSQAPSKVAGLPRPTAPAAARAAARSVATQPLSARKLCGLVRQPRLSPTSARGSVLRAWECFRLLWSWPSPSVWRLAHPPSELNQVVRSPRSAQTPPGLQTCPRPARRRAPSRQLAQSARRSTPSIAPTRAGTPAASLPPQ